MLPISISFPSPYLFLPIPTITQLVPKILPSTMSATEQAEVGAGRPSLTAVTGILVAGVIASFALFVLVFFLYLRAKRYWGAIPVSVPAVGARASLAEPGAATSAPQQRRGLEAATVAALPSLVFRSGDCRDGLECAVCLCELSEGEAARLLPRCSHAFHLECIDTWFSSHSTCPLCRNPVVVALENAEDADSGAGLAHPEESSPENPADAPLCASEDRASWGDPGSQEGSSSSSGCSSGSPQAALAIEIPGRAVDGFQTPNSPLPASVLPEDEVVRSPPAATLRSLRRILIRGSRMGCASCSPRGCDVEQGCVPVSKVPTSS